MRHRVRESNIVAKRPLAQATMNRQNAANTSHAHTL